MMFQQDREAVVDTCLDLAEKGYLAGTGGNVALRVDPDHFLVTPSATDYYAMGPPDICVMRLEGAEQIEGEKDASVEAGLHARVLTARPDCNASVHTHQPIASAYTLLDRPLEVKHPDTVSLLGNPVPCVAYAPSGTGWLAKRVGQAFDATTHACLMRNHGVVCVGADIVQAIERVAALEATCAGFFSERLGDSVSLPAAIATLIGETLASASNTPNREPTP